jgi:integrase
MASSTFDKRWKEATMRAGIRAVNFHALRHTAATLALQDDRIPPHVVAAMLGHSSVAFTLATYAHVTHASAEALVDAINARYGQLLHVVGS